MTLSENDLVKIVPSKRQIKHQETEFYAFFHFSVNTYTDKEWGDGTEDPALFNPTDMDAGQWVRSVKNAGMKGAILTCKHHDGFCLWPSKYTSHTIVSSPYRNGSGDIVKEVSDACHREGLKFGVYLSPWDRNSTVYGRGRPYNDYFVLQLEELLTGYGEIFTVWLDGACGEGADGRKQDYDWNRYYDVIRRLQPGACIAVCGPDVRWCGNEAGQVRAQEWSVVPAKLAEAERIQASSQQCDDTEFRKRIIRSSDLDLGSRQALDGETELIWYPAEVNTSIRPGWFYHRDEDGQVKSLEQLLDIYYGSVGGNATFLLNVPPAPEGRVHENDVKRLREMGDYLRLAFSCNLTEQASISADSDDGVHTVNHVKRDDGETYFKTCDGVRAVQIDILFKKEHMVSFVVLKEHILCSQRIERFDFQIERGGSYHTVFKGTVVGYKKIIPLGENTIPCRKMRIRIWESRVSPTLQFVGVYPDMSERPGEKCEG